MPFIHAAAMFVAAFFAGVVNSIAGGGMLLTFPLLIWLGLDPKVSNATCTVALWPGLFGGLFGYRREMNDSSLILMRLGVISVIGGGIGAWLLIATPAPMFARLVPFLILFATILFMMQTPVNRWLHLPAVGKESTKAWWIGAIVFQFFSAIYGGYFGAGNGILMLAAMGLLVRGGDLDVVHLDAPGVGLQEPHDMLERHALADAALAEDEEDLPGSGLEGEVAQDQKAGTAAGGIEL